MNENKINVIKNEKLSSIFLVEISEILNEEFKKYYKNFNRFLITLINVSFSIKKVKVYINIYPFADHDIVKYLYSQSSFYRKILSKRLRYRVKKIPKLELHILNLKKKNYK